MSIFKGDKKVYSSVSGRTTPYFHLLCLPSHDNHPCRPPSQIQKNHSPLLPPPSPFPPLAQVLSLKIHVLHGPPYPSSSASPSLYYYHLPQSSKITMQTYQAVKSLESVICIPHPHILIYVQMHTTGRCHAPCNY